MAAGCSPAVFSSMGIGRETLTIVLMQDEDASRHSCQKTKLKILASAWLYQVLYHNIIWFSQMIKLRQEQLRQEQLIHLENRKKV